MIITLCQKTIRSVSSPFFMSALLKVAIYSSLITLGAMALWISGIWYGMSLVEISFTSWSWLDKQVDSLIDTIAGSLAIMVAWLLFPILSILIMGLFQETIADAIEKEEYPERFAHHIPFQIMKELPAILGFIIKTILLNILCMPLYLIPGVNIILYYLLNAYLIGRELFSMIGSRHIGQHAAERLRKSHRISMILMGGVVVLLGTMPIIGLLAPLVAIILALHCFHALWDGNQTVE